MSWRIPFNRALPLGHERQYLEEALTSGHLSGDGPWTKRCEKRLGEDLGVARALLTTSCTHALELAALLLELKPGDEVIVPSFAFVTSASAFALHGGRPRFVDIREDTLNLDETRLEEAITSRTRAIVLLHYAGVACAMDEITAIARRHGLPIIEDNAHGLFGRYREQWLGTFGRLATLSFHETKNFSCGEGGALLINDPALAARAEILREKGTDRSRFFRGEVDKYTWTDLGSSYVPSDLLASLLCAQLEERERIQQRRREIWETYRRELAAWAASLGARLPEVPAECASAFHLFHLLMPSEEVRRALIAHLKAKSVLAVFHYLPLHLSRMGRHYGGRPGDCPVTESVSDRLLRLPFFNTLSEGDQREVIEGILEFR
jgi:dTDP-4-amino-4,6-dideoxygalactose transaminase